MSHSEDVPFTPEGIPNLRQRLPMALSRLLTPGDGLEIVGQHVVYDLTDANYFDRTNGVRIVVSMERWGYEFTRVYDGKYAEGPGAETVVHASASIQRWPLQRTPIATGSESWREILQVSVADLLGVAPEALTYYALAKHVGIAHFSIEWPIADQPAEVVNPQGGHE
jgi:hypothetical protein